MIERVNDIVQLIGWIAAAIVFILTQIRANRLKKKVNNLAETLEENKQNQKESEDMANFKCDKCGKSTPVGSAHSINLNGESYDLCSDCICKCSELIAAQANAELELKKAQANYEAATTALKKGVASDVPEDNATSTTLEKLGLKI